MIDHVDIESDRLVWVCEACGENNETAISGLQLGHIADPDAICMPPCACGSRETMFRRWDDRADFPHRRAINSLAQALLSAGRSHPEQKAAHGKETSAPALLVDLSVPVDDLTGRKAFAEKQAEAEARAAAREAERPAREKAAEELAAALEAAEEDRLFAEATERRSALASAAVNKRLGLPPGSEPPAEELEAELAKSADEIITDAEPPPAKETEQLELFVEALT